MSGFIAYPRAARWLYGVLTTPPIAGVAGVFEDVAPEGATDSDDKWIEFEALAPGDDVMVVGAQRVWTEFAIHVRAITRGRSTQALTAIADEIDNRLHRKSGTVSDGQVISCVRSETGGDVPDSWLRQGVEYRGLGPVFNLIVQPL
jgi:hypothetical protein